MNYVTALSESVLGPAADSSNHPDYELTYSDVNISSAAQSREPSDAAAITAIGSPQSPNSPQKTRDYTPLAAVAVLCHLSCRM